MSEVRGVLDTNVVLSARRSANPRSAAHELLARCRAGEWTLLYSRDVFLEYAEKLSGLGAERGKIVEFITLLTALGVEVMIEYFHLRHYPSDSDDTAFLLCAWNGAASHLASFDHHLLNLASSYRGAFDICRLRQMLEAVRASRETGLPGTE